MSTSLILILANTHEIQKILTQVNTNFQVIEELGEFFYLQEEISQSPISQNHYKLEAYYKTFTSEQTILAFSSNFSRAFWSQHLKYFKVNFDSIEVHNLHLLQENVKLKGKAIRSSTYLKTLKRFLSFWDRNLIVHSDIFFAPSCDAYFALKPMGLLRLQHYKQLASRYDFDFFYLDEGKRISLQFLYELCLGLMLKEVLGLFHEHQSSRHTSR